MAGNYKNCDEEITAYFESVEREVANPMLIKFKLQVNTKQKALIKISKVPDQYVDLINADILVTFSEEYYDSLDEEDKKILIEQELSRIDLNMEKGTIKVKKPNMQTSVGTVRKYTWEKVEKANETERLLAEQKDDKERNG